MANNNFTAKYDFVENEKEILQWWDEAQIFQKLREKNANGTKYRFIDGPITANNPMGIHHVWGRTMKDTFLRYKAMCGYESHYRNGFDSQGLWVEVEVEKELGFKTKRDIESFGIDNFSKKCIERVKKCSSIITEQSKRLGQWMDWDNSYYTYNDSNITGIWSFLKICNDNQWIKKIHRPMPWCPRCGTSLSEHEMSGSYKEIEHEAVFVKLPLTNHNADILVWTTTPWTLSSNVALAVNEDLDYVLVKLRNEDKPLWMGKQYFDKKYSEKNESYEIIRTVKGMELNGMEYETCFPELSAQENILHYIVLWEDVMEGEGCGVVHIAPGCGVEDFELGKRNNLPIILPIDESGVFYESFGFLSGKQAKEVNEEVFFELKERGKLFYKHKYKHSYPICWRCKQEILFRLVDEWAISVDEIRPNLLKNAAKVKWNPAYQGKRMEDWLMNMSDWCISRSRFYGLPLPIYECSNCGKVTVIGSYEELRQRAVNKELVDEMPHLHRPWIDEVSIYCPRCSSEVSRIKQVGDVWLDAGIVPFSTLKYFDDKEYWSSYFPAEYVIEMKEQIRLWFYSMLFMSTVLVDEPPYEQVGTHGMVTAENGSKFSKTGFMIRFDDAANKIGADASRYIFASTSMSNDVRFGYNLGVEARKKLLNYYNIAVFFMTYAEIDHPYINLSLMDYTFNPSDMWLLAKTTEVLNKSTEYYNSYNTKEIIQLFESIVDDISNFYIRVNRKRFWIEGDSEDKTAAYATLMFSLKILTQMMAPVIPFNTEYVWTRVICKYSVDEPESVHLSQWPVIFNSNENTKELNKMVENVREMITLSFKIRNEKQIKVKQKLECVWIWTDSGSTKIDAYFEEILRSEINVSEIKYVNSKSELQNMLLKLNFRRAGEVLKQDITLVNRLVNELGLEESERLSKNVLEGKPIRLLGYDMLLEAELFQVDFIEKKYLGIAITDQLAVALDIRISKQLKVEGLLRSFLRQCQIARKNAGLKVSDKIYMRFSCDEQFMQLFMDNLSVIEKELLAVISEDFHASFETEFDLEGHNMKILLAIRRE